MSRSLRTILVLCCLMALGSTNSAASDSLGLLRSEVRSDQPADDEHRSRKPRRHRHDDDCHDDDDGYLGRIYFYAFSSPWWIPKLMLGDEANERGYFARYPYAPQDTSGNYPGYMVIYEPVTTPPYTWAGRVSGYYGDDFDSLSTVGGQLLLEHACRLGFDTTADFRHEQLAHGQSDELWTGDFNLVYRFAQNERIQMRSGLGFNYLSDTLGTEYGLNFTYSGDCMLADPLVLSTEFDLGSLGSSTLIHFRSTLGAVFHGVEVFGGYDYYSVGDAEIGIFVSGVRVWF